MRKMSVLLAVGHVPEILYSPLHAAARSPRASNLLLSASLSRRISVKPVFRSQCAIAALMLIFSAVSYAQAQTASATPDPFVTQVTSSPAGFYSFANDISANGRFVVFESNGDVATEKIASKNPDGTANPNARNNEDGNGEIFLLDYAQRRIFQITNTKNVQKAPASPTPTPTPTPTPSASPTPSPSPTPPHLSQVKIELSNNRPMLTRE